LRGPISLIIPRITFGRLIVWICATAVIAACIVRYAQAPSFWLDEALVALSLRNPSLQSILARLERGLYFPRVYLTCIAALREIFGYQIWVLRLLPTLSFVVGTVFWARLLAKRCGSFLPLGLLGGVLLIGSSFWLDQAINLRHYTFDVMLALVPFLLDDTFFREALAGGRRKRSLVLLAAPCFLSYVYPIALGARVVGWYVHYGRSQRWRINVWGVCVLVLVLASGLATIWATDYRFGADLTGYWNGCILRSRIQEGFGSGLRLVADLMWGWHHGRLMPLVIAVVAPLQALGFYSLMRQWKNHDSRTDDVQWGSRTFGSIVLLAGVILASVVVNYPICAGRLTLFAQVHTQLLALEGALLVIKRWGGRFGARVLLCIALTVVTVYSVHRYIDFMRSEPPDNIRVMLPLIKPEIANTVWVHPCSVAQVKSLPEPLPVEEVLLNTKRNLPEPGQRVWVLWTHMSEGDCKERLEEIRSRALSWQVVHEGFSRGLALAEF
jgi:hypothetical protein